jgi:hypothetical protein
MQEVVKDVEQSKVDTTTEIVDTNMAAEDVKQPTVNPEPSKAIESPEVEKVSKQAPAVEQSVELVATSEEQPVEVSKESAKADDNAKETTSSPSNDELQANKPKRRRRRNTQSPYVGERKRFSDLPKADIENNEDAEPASMHNGPDTGEDKVTTTENAKTTSSVAEADTTSSAQNANSVAKSEAVDAQEASAEKESAQPLEQDNTEEVKATSNESVQKKNDSAPVALGLIGTAKGYAFAPMTKPEPAQVVQVTIETQPYERPHFVHSGRQAGIDGASKWVNAPMQKTM